MPITQVRIINPQYAFEEQLGSGHKFLCSRLILTGTGVVEP
jgi:hypothetical protein